ncbi:MAG: cytochrome bd-type quinol oxidase subunit 1 [Myxococcaceae bacterium]|nr:cytochrome bd-type quinol oxidase subunit 1 [Myxococcaceae bacterium]
MSDLFAARLQMGTSLGFQIVFACIGMTMPWQMALASYRWLRTRDPVYRDLAKAWSKGVAVFFAVGAVSGTVLSFELGLLWPTFMEHAGAIIGLPFSWEGTAFFTEAIALGLFLYGWERLPERVHFASGLVVGISGVFSGVLVVSANAWMNSPRGFRWVDGHAVDVDPVAAMFNDAWLTEALHMVIAAFVSTCFAVAGVHALRLLRGGRAATFHQKALRMALGMGSVFALLQPLSGDLSAKDVARRQPAKLAAMEAHYHTERDAKLVLGGIPDDATGEVRYGLELPYLLSILAKGDPHAEVQGLDQIPKALRPPTLVCHIAFQVMVAAGMAMMTLGALYWWLRWRRPAALYSRGFLRLVALATPLGFIAVEAGWTVTEVGRQPWIIYGVMRTSDAVSAMPGLVWPLLMSLFVYALLVVVVISVMTRLVRATEHALDARLDGPVLAKQAEHA